MLIALYLIVSVIAYIVFRKAVIKRKSYRAWNDIATPMLALSLVPLLNIFMIVISIVELSRK